MADSSVTVGGCVALWLCFVKRKEKKIEVHIVLFLKGFAQTDALTVNVLHVVT